LPGFSGCCKTTRVRRVKRKRWKTKIRRERPTATSWYRTESKALSIAAVLPERVKLLSLDCGRGSSDRRILTTPAKEKKKKEKKRTDYS